MTIARTASGGPWRSLRRRARGRRARRVLDGAAAPTSGGSGRRPRRRARGRAASSPYWSWTPTPRRRSPAFEEAVPERRRRARQRRHRQRAVHEAAERDQGRLGRARRRADRVLRACRSSPSPTRSSTSSQYGFDELEDHVHASTWGGVNAGGELFGLPQDSGPDGAVLQQGGLRQVRHRRADHVGRVRRRGAQAARGRPDDVHHHRHRRRRLHHEHDLAGRRPPVRDRRHRTSRSTSPTRAPRSGPASGTSSSRRSCSRRSPAGATSGTRASATAPSPRSPPVPGCPACLESGVPDGAGDWRVAPMPTYDGSRGRPPRTAAAASRSLKQSKNPALAAAFLRWLNNDPASIDVVPRERRLPGDDRRPRGPRVPRQRESDVLRRPEDQRGAHAGREGRGRPAGSTCPTRCTRTASSATPSARRTRTRSDLNDGLADWQEPARRVRQRAGLHRQQVAVARWRGRPGTPGRPRP